MFCRAPFRGSRLFADSPTYHLSLPSAGQQLRWTIIAVLGWNLTGIFVLCKISPQFCWWVAVGGHIMLKPGSSNSCVQLPIAVPERLIAKSALCELFHFLSLTFDGD